MLAGGKAETADLPANRGTGHEGTRASPLVDPRGRRCARGFSWKKPRSGANDSGYTTKVYFQHAADWSLKRITSTQYQGRLGT